ncbi:MAG TPA: hypothetical protein VG821_11350 [Rhizomicrobium sp.]|jgi:hypothetical protein|nr:hypothetical protein [Rhizomicrobium sp.]
MGIARLLAKGWIIFCLFAGAHALRLALLSGLPADFSLAPILICAGLFMAMGLLFVGGFGASAGLGHTPLLQGLRPSHLIPGFNESVFLIFVLLSFFNQVFVAPGIIERGGAGALANAVYFLVPGQRALVGALQSCALDGGRVFAAAFAWLLAIIYLASAVSRLRLQAGLIRLEAGERPQPLGPTLRAFLFGIVAVVGIQFLFVGSAFPWLACSAFADITGALLIGLAPLMLSYLIVAALASLLASSAEP